jgi:2'-5' RNA ligase
MSNAESGAPGLHEHSAASARAQGLSIHLPRALEQRLRWGLGERGIPHPPHFHLTLKYPFLPTVDMSGRLDSLERLIRDRPALHLRSAGMLPSPSTYCHLLLIQPSAELLRLHADVMELLRGCGPVVNPVTSQFEGSGYNPHVTLSYGAGAEDFEMRDALFAEYEPTIEFEARSVELFEKEVEGNSVAREGDSAQRAGARSFRFAAG